MRSSSRLETLRLVRLLPIAVACFAVSAAPRAQARQRHRRTVAGTSVEQPHDNAASGVLGSGKSLVASENDLYRSRGCYGIGGVPFTLGGGGDLATSGACAQVANRNPACGPSGYGNGLGHGFGSP